MNVVQAKALIAALQTAVAGAEAASQDEIPPGALAAVLDARLAAALADLQAAVADRG